MIDLPSDLIGKRFKNNADQEYEVLFVSGKRKCGTKLYRIKFIKTGYERDVEKVEMKRGKIKDRFERSVFGIGYIGDINMADNKQEYSVWSGMLERCYWEKSESYDRYGGIGVAVDEKWHCFKNFLDDITLIDGYDKSKFKNRQLNLDKDKKQKHIPISERIYSLKTCTFLSQADNNRLIDRTRREKSFYVVSPSGKIIHTQGIKRFCREHNNFDRKGIQKCLRNELDDYKGWKFKINIEELV